MSCAFSEKDIFTVVDYGTADGANFLTILEDINGNFDLHITISETTEIYVLDKRSTYQVGICSYHFKPLWIRIF